MGGQVAGVTPRCQQVFVGREHPGYGGTCGGDGIGTGMGLRSLLPAQLCPGWRKGPKSCGGDEGRTHRGRGRVSTETSFLEEIGQKSGGKLGPRRPGFRRPRPRSRRCASPAGPAAAAPPGGRGGGDAAGRSAAGGHRWERDRQGISRWERELRELEKLSSCQGGYGKLGDRPGGCRPSKSEGRCSWGLILAEIMLGILLAAGNTHTRPMVISFSVLRC